MPPKELECQPLNHTQIIIEHTGVLATLQSQNKNILDELKEIKIQNIRQYDLMNRYDLKQDDLIKTVSNLIKDTEKLKYERNILRNAIVWFIGIVATGTSALIIKFWDKIKI